MNAPARATSGQPVMLFTLAWNDALRLRMQQVEVNGHTPAADDATGPRALAAKAQDQLIIARDRMGYGHALLTADQRAAARRRLLAAATLALAAIDTIDRLDTGYDTPCLKS